MTVTVNASPAPINTDFILFTQIISRDLDISEDCVDSFLVFIAPHPNLRALVAIANHLNLILPVAQQVTDDRKLREQIHSWLRICEYVVDHAEKLIVDFPEINQQSKNNNKRAPFPKQFEVYPLYISLWYGYPRNVSMTLRH